MYTPETLPFAVVLDFCNRAEQRQDFYAIEACEKAALGSADHLRWVTDQINKELANKNNTNVNNNTNG